MKAPKLIAAILCDDIRIENNNKLLPIGVYGDSIVVAEFPTLLALRILLIIRAGDIGDSRFHMKLSAPGLVQPLKMDGQVHVGTPNQQSVLAGPQFGFLCSEPGSIRIDASFDTQRTSRILEIAINKAGPGAIAPQVS